MYFVTKDLRADFDARSSCTPSKCSSSRLSAARTAQASWVAMGLIRAGRQYCLMHGVTYGFFLISDPLARILRRLGMDIEPVGSPCQHRGWRSPYIHNVKTGYEAMSVRSPDLYDSFCRADAYARYSDLVVRSSARANRRSRLKSSLNHAKIAGRTHYVLPAIGKCPGAYPSFRIILIRYVNPFFNAKIALRF